MSGLGWVVVTSIAWIIILFVIVGIMADRRGEREGLRGPTTVFDGNREPELTEEERDEIEAEARAFRVALRRARPEDFDRGNEEDEYAGIK